MPRTARSRLLVPFALLALASAQAPCPPQGLTLAARGGRLGDAFAIALTGATNAVGIVGYDTAPGPTPTPIGTVCLGLTPQLATEFVVLDGAGHGGVQHTLPATARLAGVTVHTAAVAVDASRPNGFATSNGGVLALHQPRLYCIAPGSSSPFGTIPGSLAAVNALTADVAFTQPLTTSVRAATFVRERGWLVLLLGTGTLLGLDGSTGATVFQATFAGTAASASAIAAPVGGDRLVLMSTGTPAGPFGGGTPGSVHLVALPTGTVTTIPLASGNPTALLLAPDSPLAFLQLPTGVIPFDHVAGALRPTVPLPTGFGSIVDWQVSGGILYCLHAGQPSGPFGGPSLPAALSAIVVGTQLVLFTSQLAMPVPAQLLRAGPGTTGPSLYVYGSTAGRIDEFVQGTGTLITSIPVGSGIAALELSALGTQWLLACNGNGCGGPSLLTIPGGTTAVLPLFGLPAGLVTAPIAVSPSSGIGRAVVATGTSSLALLVTDPFVAPFVTVPLPIAGNAFVFVSD